jgi:transposase
LQARKAEAVIPPRRNRAPAITFDKEMYKWRHLIEDFLARIKEFRRIAPRYDRTDTS